MTDGLPGEAKKIADKALGRPLTEAEIERQQRDALGFYDAEKHRREIIKVKALSPQEREQAAAENEYRLLELQREFGEYAQDMMAKIKASDNAKNEFGRGSVTRAMGTVAKFLIEGQRLSLEREKFEWAKRVYSETRMQDFTNDLASGIVVDITVEEKRGKTGDEAGGIAGIEGEAP